MIYIFFFFFQAEDGIRDLTVTGVQTCALPISLEIIPLRHRTVDQVLPALQPLVEPGGALTGQSGQIIVRASPANLAEIKRALEAIDRPLRRLQISVRFDDALESARQGIEAGGRIGGGGSRVDVRAQGARSAAAERVDQRLVVLEAAAPSSPRDKRGR